MDTGTNVLDAMWHALTGASIAPQDIANAAGHDRPAMVVRRIHDYDTTCTVYANVHANDDGTARVYWKVRDNQTARLMHGDWDHTWIAREVANWWRV